MSPHKRQKVPLPFFFFDSRAGFYMFRTPSSPFFFFFPRYFPVCFLSFFSVSFSYEIKSWPLKRPPEKHLSAEDVQEVLLALVDLGQDLLVVLLQELVGQLVLFGEEAVERLRLLHQLRADVVDHARDYRFSLA